jgi:hypothetical protein
MNRITPPALFLIDTLSTTKPLCLLWQVLDKLRWPF